MPNPFPSSIMPITINKNLTDFRKILIEGSNEATITLAENLRRLGYQGNIGILNE
jgi:hypothetical protein